MANGFYPGRQLAAIAGRLHRNASGVFTTNQSETKTPQQRPPTIRLTIAIRDPPDIGRAEEVSSVRRQDMNLLSPTLATTNAVSPQRPAVPIRVDPDAKLLAALRRRDRTAADGPVAHYGSRAYGPAMASTRNARECEATANYQPSSMLR